MIHSIFDECMMKKMKKVYDLLPKWHHGYIYMNDCPMWYHTVADIDVDVGSWLDTRLEFHELYLHVRIFRK